MSMNEGCVGLNKLIALFALSRSVSVMLLNLLLTKILLFSSDSIYLSLYENKEHIRFVRTLTNMNFSNKGLRSRNTYQTLFLLFFDVLELE